MVPGKPGTDFVRNSQVRAGSKSKQFSIDSLIQIEHFWSPTSPEPIRSETARFGRAPNRRSFLLTPLFKSSIFGPRQARGRLPGARSARFEYKNCFVKRNVNKPCSVLCLRTAPFAYTYANCSSELNCLQTLLSSVLCLRTAPFTYTYANCSSELNCFTTRRGSQLCIGTSAGTEMAMLQTLQLSSVQLLLGSGGLQIEAVFY